MKRMTIILLFGLLLAAIAAGSAVSEGTEPEKEHPCIRIMTEDGQPILSREEYVPATIH